MKRFTLRALLPLAFVGLLVAKASAGGMDVKTFRALSSDLRSFYVVGVADALVEGGVVSCPSALKHGALAGQTNAEAQGWADKADDTKSATWIVVSALKALGCTSGTGSFIKAVMDRK